ncbi:MAG: XRE family transcriptional regulator [Candidatus Melainabacteria bacterium]|nr:XRE family transcriptional regulator [Candidatus Melainabacteria bacterium]
MSLCQKLQESRSQARLTQQQVADVLHVPRESISMWEQGTRVPGLKQLEDLARLYSVTSDYLLGKTELAPQVEEREVLCRGLVENPSVHLEFKRWFDFLDSWADLTEQAGLPARNSGKPPKKLDRGADFTDGRQAPTLAAETRKEFGLGGDAIPDVYTFLDEQHILVCKANLGDWQTGAQGISGAFHNHRKLGYCILVNVQNSLGRQSFTLAHELAHALFHYNCRSLISIYKDPSPRESFADSFASHFLVPIKTLNRVIDNASWSGRLDQYKVIELAHIFRVSYAFMLYRLRNEKHITDDQRKAWEKCSPTALAQQLGLDSDVFNKPGNPVLSLNRYPASVVQTVRDLIFDDELSSSQAADLLDVSTAHIQALLMTDLPPATPEERRELCEYPF